MPNLYATARKKPRCPTLKLHRCHAVQIVAGADLTSLKLATRQSVKFFVARETGLPLTDLLLS